MTNHMFKLTVLTLFFGLAVTVSHAEEVDESEQAYSATSFSETETPVAEPETSSALAAEFADSNFEDPLAPLPDNDEAVQAGRDANAIVYSMTSSGVDSIFPMNYSAADDLHDSGYMAQGMDPLLAGTLVANVNVDALFKKYSAMRLQSGITLPEEFRSLVGYIEGYIKAHSKAGSDTANGMTNWVLAVHIVKASFCFGNDPFMLTAKIRRETSFNRTLVSSGSAVGFSQMTGPGIKEVQDQMSGNSRISMPGALRSFQMAARCYAGIQNFRLPVLNNVDMKKELRSRFRLDLTFGQVMTKAYASYAKATGRLTSSAEDITKAYTMAFVSYNGDSTPTAGTCVGQKSVEMKLEYACDINQYFTQMSTNWDSYIRRQKRNARANQTF